MSLRKSQRFVENVDGNQSKFHAYREAWSRMEQAISDGYFLEAVTIAESIISDRLVSYLRSHSNLTTPGPRASFSKIISVWRRTVGGNVRIHTYKDLVSAVDAWRKERNTVVHAITKVGSGANPPDIDEFLRKAEHAAREGRRLAKAVSTWRQRFK